MESLKQLFVNIGTIDRRWIFFIVGLSVFIPLISPVEIPIQTSSHSQTVYDALDSLEDSSKVLVSFEYGPSTKPEIHPMAIGIMRFLLSKNHKIFGIALWPDRLFMSQEVFQQVADLCGIAREDIFPDRKGARGDSCHVSKSPGCEVDGFLAVSSEVSE